MQVGILYQVLFSARQCYWWVLLMWLVCCHKLVTTRELTSTLMTHFWRAVAGAAHQHGSQTGGRWVEQKEQEEGEVEEPHRRPQLHDSNDSRQDQQQASWQQRRRLVQLQGQHQQQRGSTWRPRSRRRQLQQRARQLLRQQSHNGAAADARPNVAMLTAVPPTPCKAPLADLINSLSLANKVRGVRHPWYA